MVSKSELNVILEKILYSIEEGVHVIDNHGKTLLYNDEMGTLEEMNSKDVIGSNLLTLFPSLNEESSTLLRVLKTEKPIINKSQTYLNHEGKQITTINSTFPLYYNNEKIGALEVAKNITKIKKLSDQIQQLQDQLIEPMNNKEKKRNKYNFDHLIGKSGGFFRAISIARKATKTSSSVLIYGETGTGKEIFAQSIHNESVRKNKPFIGQNCAALPENLLEGILFGTKKGSFTGAVDRPGIFEQANGGTILLDEIDSMDQNLQAKLLRVLQENYIRRIGGTKDISIDVRIIATTNQEPNFLLENNLIRKDLYYRLSVLNIVIPPLRKREYDLDLLSEYFIDKYNQKFNNEVWMLSDGVKDIFKNYHWPGNVRELENIIEGAMNLIHQEHVIKEEHLSSYLIDYYNSTQQKAAEVMSEEGQSTDYEAQAQEMDLNRAMESFEKQLIAKALRTNGQNISRAAKMLNIKRQTLQYKIKKYTLDG
ncbi:sigma-54 interaction domain-containing protein [Isachenkonia alkalipeptolytica]|uniref:PAS domain S-box protein n=1 Tax=Isachenkonia alkalipeptolytica TaxID=2565777 RepID=A0AA44BEA3_9CLOT|nr:sigma 54-interacting transcriptional regulator [Isachenkonia alkalipeptolytica]NBG88723.1 PAS domain S-box protein [Isachenkonia alkalipeptolytica]